MVDPCGFIVDLDKTWHMCSPPCVIQFQNKQFPFQNSHDLSFTKMDVWPFGRIAFKYEGPIDFIKLVHK